MQQVDLFAPIDFRVAPIRREKQIPTQLLLLLYFCPFLCSNK